MGSDIFIKEDTAKPENITNLALFGILAIPEIHSFVFGILDIPMDAIIFPSPNLAAQEFDSQGGRPDFKIMRSFHHKRELGYIEVELGREDEAQIADYRSKVNARVYSIVGKKSYREDGGNGDLSLEEVRDFVERIKAKYQSSQPYASLELFSRLVKYYVIDGNHRLTDKRADLSEQMLKTPLVAKTYEYFGEESILRNARSQPGKILLDTVKENGFSLRVYCRKSKSNGFSLMSRSAGRPIIYFPSSVSLPQNANSHCASR